MIIKEQLAVFNKFIIFSSLLIISIVSCNDSRKTTGFSAVSETIEIPVLLHSKLERKASKGLIYYQKKCFTGIGEMYYPSGKKATSIQYVAGKRQGYYRKWFEDGTLSFEANYENGKQEGKVITWWKNGKMRSKANFQNGRTEGVQEQWYQSGKKFKVLNMVNGREEGLQQSWRENGAIYSNYEAKNGRIFGLKRANLCYELKEETIQYAD